MAVIGGAGSVVGALLGATVITALRTALQDVFRCSRPGLGISRSSSTVACSSWRCNTPEVALLASHKFGCRPAERGNCRKTNVVAPRIAAERQRVAACE